MLGAQRWVARAPSRAIVVAKHNTVLLPCVPAGTTLLRGSRLVA